MYKYDIKKDTWEDTNRPMRVPRSGHSCLLLNNEIFVAGGNGGTVEQWKTTEIFNLESNTWRSGPDLPKEMWYFQLVKAQSSSRYSAFLIGGIEVFDALSGVYGLEKDFKSFQKIGDLKTARYGNVAFELPEIFNLIEVVNDVDNFLDSLE